VTSDETQRIAEGMARLLREPHDEVDGWTSVDRLLAELSRRLSVAVDAERLVRASASGGFEFADGRVRLSNAEDGQEPSQSRGRAGRDANEPRPATHTPDILYHATTEAEVFRIRQSGRLSAGSDRHVFLSADEAQAWRVAHRMTGGAPVVLYVDAARARRHGVKFFRNRRSGLHLSTAIPFGDILNLQPGFGEQVSAGGIPIVGRGGDTRMALIRVTRRSGTTWEVAKGKLEPGESPEQAAVREVQEEMGVTVGLGIKAHLGAVRYGFLAPGGLPRLKTVHLFLMEPLGAIESFTPATNEGIAAVRWFPLPEAVRAVTHPSLVPVVRRAAEGLERGWPFDRTKHDEEP
jgi:RNA:NAD 2'-phosphotransferase (TPT1/KptA family)/8-oxo-dGTP pyrophosphatase MutT (NUDIX family)